jgi:hypothetical protein
MGTINTRVKGSNDKKTIPRTRQRNWGNEKIVTWGIRRHMVRYGELSAETNVETLEFCLLAQHVTFVSKMVTIFQRIIILRLRNLHAVGQRVWTTSNWCFHIIVYWIRIAAVEIRYDVQMFRYGNGYTLVQCVTCLSNPPWLWLKEH